MEKQFWNYGEKSRVAKAAGVPPQKMTDITKGYRQVSVKRARALEIATLRILGASRVVPAAAWLGLEEHPAIERKELI